MNSDEIKQKYFFHSNEKTCDNFFCPCGGKFKVKKQIDTPPGASATEEYKIKVEGDSFKKFDVDDFLGSIDSESSHLCPKCGKTASDFKKIGLKFNVNTNFYKEFTFEETSDLLLLNKILYQGFYDVQTDKFEIKSTVESIFLNKLNKEIGIKMNDDVVFIELENLFDSINEFYDPVKDKQSVKIMDNLINVHIFLGRTANFLRDTKNINLVSGLMDEINGNRGIGLSEGISVLTKVTCIFLAIAKYENLATIALVKSGIFLFELLKDCELPNSSVLKELNLTKPIQIFNYLINLETKKIQEKIDKSDKKNQKYGYKSVKLQSGAEILIKSAGNFEDEINYTRVKKSDDGTIVFKDRLETTKISPFFFKKIKTVNEYKLLVKYCKFLNYNELVNLVMKYDSTFLISLFNYIEYRNDIGEVSIDYFLSLYADFFSKKDTEYEGKEFKDYMIYFDDSKRILVSLKWNVRKELLKIRKCNELEKYHNWLVKQYNNTVEKKESKINFQNFVDKYKAIEDYVHPDIEIKLIDTVEGLLFWAKQLKNSAAEYAINVEKGIYLMAMINYKTYKQDSDVSHLKNFMLGLKVDKRGMLEFDQLKSTANQLASNKLKTIVMDYLREKDISYRELEDLALTEKSKSKAKQAEFMYNTNVSLEQVDGIDFDSIKV